LEGVAIRALIRTWTVSFAGTRPPSFTIFLISAPSLEPYSLVSNEFKYQWRLYLGDFSAHQVAGGNVGVSKLFNQLGTLCSLTGGGATEDKSKLGVSKDLLNLLLLLMGSSVVFVCVLIAHSRFVLVCLFT
jgi:hypothetical protein